MAVQTTSAYQALVLLDNYCRQGTDRSEQSGVPTESVVCFSLAGSRYAVPFSEIVELLDPLPSTRLPRVKSWVKGLANLRGRLLPIIDLAEFTGCQLSNSRKQQKILVMDRQGVFVGLLIDQVVGMRHFPEDAHVDAESEGGALDGYLEGAYRDGDQLWGVFKPSMLISDSQFMSVTA